MNSPRLGTTARKPWSHGGTMKLARLLIPAACLIALTALLSGCGQKSAQNAGTATSDSLLASSPMEQPQDQLQPQSTGVPEGSTEQNAPAPQTQGSTPAQHSSSSSSSSKPKPAPAAKPSA